MIAQDHLALSLRHERESITGYVLYWDKAGHIVHTFNKHNNEEVMPGTPERALMQYMLSRARHKEIEKK
jgi:hypothetical protein